MIEFYGKYLVISKISNLQKTIDYAKNSFSSFEQFMLNQLSLRLSSKIFGFIFFSIGPIFFKPLFNIYYFKLSKYLFPKKFYILKISLSCNLS